MAENGEAQDLEKNETSLSNVLGRFKPTSDDDACFKLWNMYISQAQGYDRALIESWKSDMDGMLLFSALYSAVLAAFIIESYKNLQEDAATTTASLLKQMSQQIALLSNGSSSTFQEPESFHPTASSLVCNLAWFLALALALTCSLLATFVQQWTRDFLHKTTMRPSPVVQARVLAFSYFGLRRFGMHTFVDTIPMLLHISLFFFFAGLVAFLLPVNFLLMCLMACILTLFMLVYLGLSYIPLIFLDAPYRTPLSDFLWRVGNHFRGYITQKHGLRNDLSLNEAIIEKSLQDPSSRDCQCMEYTMKQLDFDTELVPMFEAIPEAVLSPRGGVRLENFKLVASLIQPSEPENSIVSRISNFISISGTSSDPANQIRDMTYCLKALRSLAQLVIAKPAQNDIDYTQVFWFDRSLLQNLGGSNAPLRDHLISTIALVRTSRLQSLRRCIDKVAHVLSLPSTPADERLQTASDVFRCVSLDDIDWNSRVFKDHFIGLERTFFKRTSDVWRYRGDELVEEARGIVSRLQNPGRWKGALISILGEFLSKAISDKVTPIDMELTWKIIHSSLSLSFFDRSLEVEEDEAATSYVLNNEAIRLSVVPPEMFVLVFRLFFSTNRTFSFHGSAKCRAVVHQYIIDSVQPYQMNYLVTDDTGSHLEECILHDLRTGDSDNPAYCISAIERLYFGLGFRLGPVPPRLLVFAKQIFNIIPNVSSKFDRCRWWPATKAETEWILCQDIYNRLCVSEPVVAEKSLMDDIRAIGGRLIPGIPIPEPPDISTVDLHKGWTEDVREYILSMIVVIVSKFMVMCTEDIVGYLPGDWNGMCTVLREHEGCVHQRVQLQFAESIRNLVAVVPWNQPEQTAAAQVFQDWVWKCSQHWSWITDLNSAQILADTIQRHKNDPNFRGTVWHEQALLHRCLEIAEEAAGQAETMPIASQAAAPVRDDDEIRDETGSDTKGDC